MNKKQYTILIIFALAIMLTACSGKSKTLAETSSKTTDNQKVNITGNKDIEPSDNNAAKSTTGEDNVKDEKKISNGGQVTFRELNIPWETTDCFGDGLIAFEKPNTELWGYCDYDGKVVLDAKYKFKTAFYDGYARVTAENGKGIDYIDKTGKVIYSSSFQSTVLIPFSKDKDYAYIEDRSKYYLVDKSGKVKMVYDNQCMDGNFNAYDPELESEVMATKFNTYSDILIFDRTKKYGFYDAGHLEAFEKNSIKDARLQEVVKGNDLKKLFPRLTGIGITDDYIAVSEVKINNSPAVDMDITTGLIDYSLNMIIKPGIYSYIIPLDKEHIIVATSDGKYGLVNAAGQFLIELSDKKIALMSSEQDYSNTLHNEGMLFFKPRNGHDNAKYLYNNDIVNKTGKDCILIEQESSDRLSADYEVYDLKENKVIRKLPILSLSHQAPVTYLLPEFTLVTNPFKCYDLDGSNFPKGILPDEGFSVDNVSTERSTILILDGYNKKKYIEVRTN